MVDDVCENRGSHHLTLEEAQAVTKKVRVKAAEMGVTIAAAVVDKAGLLVLSERMDGAGIMAADIAKAKAFTVVAFRGRPTEDLADLFKNNPQTFNGIAAISPIVAGGGGMPIKKSGKVVGAIGASGAKGEEDQKCAEAGVS